MNDSEIADLFNVSKATVADDKAPLSGEDPTPEMIGTDGM